MLNKVNFFTKFSFHKNATQLSRLEVLIGIGMITIFCIIAKKGSNIQFSLFSPYIILISFIFLFAFSYTNSWILNNLKRLAVILYGVTITFILYVAHQNNFSYNIFLIYLIAYAIFSFLLADFKSYSIFNIINSISLLTVLLLLDYSKFSKVFILFTYLLFLTAGTFLIYCRESFNLKIFENEKLFKKLFTHTSDGLIIIDKGKVKAINKKAIELLSLSKTESYIGHDYQTLLFHDHYLKNFDFSFEKMGSMLIKEDKLRIIKKPIIDTASNSLLIIQKNNAQDYQNSNNVFINLNDLTTETYHDLFNDSTEMICVLSKEGVIKDINQTLVRTLKYTKEELIGKNVDFLTAKNGEPKNRKELNERAWTTNEKQVFVKEILDKNGQLIPLEIHMQKGKYFGEDVLISVSRDISLQKKYQQELTKSIENFKSLFNNAPISMAILTLEGQFIDINPAMENLFGYNKDEFLKMNYTDISHPEDNRMGLELSKALIQGEINLIELEKRYFKKDGNEITTLLKVILERDIHGNPVRHLAQIDDITKLKEIQEHLSISEKSYKQLFNNTNDTIYILDFNYTIIDVNEAVLNKYGYSKEELIGKSIKILSDSDKNKGIIIEEYLSHKDQQAQNNIYFWGKIKEGSSFPMEIRTAKGLYFGKEVIFCTGRDISERYKFEEKLRKQEERYRNLFERNLAGIFRLDTNGLIIECNPAFSSLFAYASPLLMKNKVKLQEFYLYEDEHKKIEKFLQKNQLIKDQKVIFKTAKGDELVALLNISIIKNKKNEILYLEGSIIDITEQIKAERLLNESREQYRNLVENSASGLFIHQNGIINIANSRAAEILGFDSVNDLIGHNIYSSMEDKVVEKIKTRVNNILLGKQEVFKEFEIKKKTGERIIIETKPTRISIDGNYYVQVTFNDITQRKKNEENQQKVIITESINQALKIELDERKQIQEELKNAQSYTEGIIQSSIDMIYTVDNDGNIHNFNAAAQKTFGYTDEEAIGKNFKILFLNEDELDDIINVLKKEGKFTGEIYCKRKDGSNFISYLSVSYLYTTAGVIMGIMGVSRDITDIKRNEKELKSKENKNRLQSAKLNAIIESSSHYFFTLDKNYKIKSFNKKFQKDVGLIKDTLVKNGMDFFEIAFKEQEVEPKKLWKERIDITFKGERTQFEVKRVTENKATMFREVFLDPIIGNDGKIEEISGIGHDITDKKINQEKIQKSLEEKEILLKEVHHRVKNNMQVISSILNLQSSYLTDPQIKSILNESQNRIKSMAYIHESLYRTKDFSHIDFSKYIKNLTINLVETYEVYSSEIDLKFELDNIFLNLDSAIPCGLILNELISNALKYAFVERNSGLIYLSLKEKEEIVLKIKDNGIGFPNNVDYANTESLGLQLVITLVDQLNGKIAMKSSSTGTAFTVSFPRIK